MSNEPNAERAYVLGAELLGEPRATAADLKRVAAAREHLSSAAVRLAGRVFAAQSHKVRISVIVNAQIAPS